MIDNADLTGARRWDTEAEAQAEATNRNKTRQPFTKWLVTGPLDGGGWAVVNASSVER